MTYSTKALRRDAYSAKAISEIDTRVTAVETAAGLSEGSLSITNADVSATAAIAPSKIDGTAVVDNDRRLTDSRTPSSTLAHSASHAAGEDDELSPDAIGAIDLAAFKTLVDTSADYAAFKAAIAAFGVA